MSLGLLFTEKQVEQNIVINIVLEVWEEVPVSNRDIGEVFPKHFLQDKLYAYAITKAREKNYNRLNWKGLEMEKERWNERIFLLEAELKKLMLDIWI